MAFFHYEDDCEDDLDRNQSQKVDAFLPRWDWLKIKKKKAVQEDIPCTYGDWAFYEVEKSVDYTQVYKVADGIKDALTKIFGNFVDVFNWLNTPLPDFDGRTPAELCKFGKSQIVLDYLEDHLLGHPG